LPESGQFGQNLEISAKLGQILAVLVRFWPIWLESDIQQRRPNIAGFRFTPLVLFSYEPNAEKSFRKIFFFLKNDFVKNILRQKTFYFETNEA
jgi:hypothetical protein